jgi:hypothetical protein
MRSLPLPGLLFISLLLQLNVNAQGDSTANETHFKMGVFYNSSLNYYGRTDSLKSSGFFPLAEWWIDQNFYINAAPVFVNNSLQRFEYAGTVATAGYQFNDTRKWAGNLYVVKPIYTRSSQLVQSALKIQAAGILTLQTKLLNISAGADIKISDKTDIGATAGLDHVFRFQMGDRSVLVLNPTVRLNAGTQQFTNTSYQKKNFLILPAYEEQVVSTSKKFTVLSYDASVPLILVTGKFQLLAIPAFVSPQNLLILKENPSLSEHGQNLFYVTIGAKIVL